MAEKFTTFEDAERRARTYAQQGAKIPAVVSIGVQIDESNVWWAVRDADDLDTVPGLVNSITTIRGGK